MPTSRNLNTYTDVRRVLDTALQHGGIRYKLPTRGKATNFRLRANTYRLLLQKQAEESVGNLPGYIPGTPYDEYIFDTEEEFFVVRPRDALGQAYAPDGTPVKLTSEPAPKFDQTDELVEVFKKQVEDD